MKCLMTLLTILFLASSSFAANIAETEVKDFRVNAQNPENSSLILSRLFVISLANNVPLFCGIAKTNEEAKEIADNATTCTTILKK